MEDEPRVQGMPDPLGPPSWSTVNIVFPLQVGGTGYFALAHWVLPRVPVIGEHVEVIGHVVKVERVVWASNGKVRIRLVEADVSVEQIETLEREGWSVGPWEDEPPKEWLEG